MVPSGSLRTELMKRSDDSLNYSRLAGLMGLVLAALLLTGAAGAASAKFTVYEAVTAHMVSGEAHAHHSDHHWHADEHDDETACGGYGHCASSAIIGTSPVAVTWTNSFGRLPKPRISLGSHEIPIDRPPIR